jgi:hypothetical protein
MIAHSSSLVPNLHSLACETVAWQIKIAAVRHRS